MSKLTKKGDGAMWASPPTNLPFQKRQGISSMRGDILRGKRHNNYVNRLHKRHPENLRYIQEKADKGVCKPQADSEERAIPPDGFLE